MKSKCHWCKLLVLPFFFFLISCQNNTNQVSDEQVTSINLEEQEILKSIVENYNIGFVEQNSAKLRNSIGDQLIMVNGNFSGDPANWQAHQFLNDQDIEEWIGMMLSQAGPFENEVEVKNISIRNKAALVVTRESGKNKFRTWSDEQVTYMLGKEQNDWKIIGYFIRDIKNPE